MTYSIPPSDYIIIDYTEVEPVFNGKGVGKQLLFKIVEMVREKTLKYCHYVLSPMLCLRN